MRSASTRSAISSPMRAVCLSPTASSRPARRCFSTSSCTISATRSRRACARSATLGAAFLTVHAYPQTMRAAVAGSAGSSLTILAVTVLTSYDDADAAEAGYAGSVADLVAARTAQAREIGIGGIVCAATEAARVRAIVGPDRLIVTPGIRPAGVGNRGSEADRHARHGHPRRRRLPRRRTARDGRRRRPGGRRRHRRRDRLGAVTRTGDTIARD